MNIGSIRNNNKNRSGRMHDQEGNSTEKVLKKSMSIQIHGEKKYCVRLLTRLMA
jgi:hypothetical protein